MRLTDAAIRQMPFLNKGQKRVRDELLPGFGITVGTNSKTFFVMQGKERKLRTLGKWPTVSLKEARAEAKLILASPVTVKRSVRLSEAREAFLREYRDTRAKSTADRYFFALKDIPDCDLDKPPLDVTDPTQLKVLKAFYNWCLDRELVDRNPYHRRKVKFAVRDRVLSDDEIAALWQYEHPPYSAVVKLLILTGQRRAQIAKFDPDWIHEDTITFPAFIMKGKKQHSIPLTEAVAELLPQVSHIGGWSKHKLRMDKHTGVSDYVLHDIRRYFSTTMAMLGVPLHITEEIIDHRSQVTGVAAIYNRYNFLAEMRDAVQAYETHVMKLVGK